MIVEPDESLLARYDCRQWIIDDRPFARWAVDGEVAVLCESRAGDSVYLGTFSRLQGVDGALWAGSQLVASQVSNTEVWTAYPFDVDWPVLRLLARRR